MTTSPHPDRTQVPGLLGALASEQNAQAGDGDDGGRDHGWGRIRQERIEFSDERVRGAVDFIAGSGIAEELQARITKPTGRPRTCNVLGLLVGMALACRRTAGSAVPLNLVTDILHWGIPDRWRRRFALKDRTDDARGFEAAYAVILRLFHDVLAVMDPSPLPKNRRIPRHEADRLMAAADQEALQARQALLVRISNQILEASYACVRHALAEHWDGSLGVDATVVATFARGTRTKGPLTSTDPDAGWYIRSGDHADPHHPNPAAPADKTNEPANPRKDARKDKMTFGYDLALGVARNPHHDPRPRPDGCGDPAQIPALIVGMKLDRPGHNPGANGIAVLTDVRRRGHPAGDLAADTAYNNSKPQDWQLPARALGYRPVYNYRQDQLGIQAQAHGAFMVEGTWYCPRMPEQLVTATQDLHRPESDPAAIDRATWRTRIDARAPYALPAKGRPDPEGHQRYQCPGSAGNVQCELKPASMGKDPRLPLIDITASPVGPPKICTQTSVTIAPEHGAKHWQPHRYGTPTWQKIYGRLRNATEGVNGYAKDDARESIERSQGRRIRGIAAQTLLLAFQLAHVNLRKIDAWLNTLPGPDGHPRRRARRRQTNPLGTWTPKGHLDDDPAA